MFQRRALEVLVLMFVCISGYYAHDYFSSDKVRKEFQLGFGNLYAYVFFIMGMVMFYMSLHHSVLCVYDHLKSKQKQRALELRRQNLLMDELERQKRFGGAGSNPYSQALQQMMISEVLTPRSKRKNMLNFQDAAFAQLQQQQHEPISPSPQTPTAPKLSIKERLTPKSKRKPNLPTANINENDVVANMPPAAIHTPKAKRKANLSDMQQSTTITTTNECNDTDAMSHRVRQIITELQTPKNKRKLQGHTNAGMQE